MTKSNFPIKIDLLSMSKSVFIRYNTDIIQPNIHRISSLHFYNVLMYDFAFSSIGKLSKLDRVKTVILENSVSSLLNDFLNQLSSLSLLISLIITSADTVQD